MSTSLERAYQWNDYKKAEEILSSYPRLLDNMYLYSATRPLGIACRDGKLDFVKLYLRFGADINEFDYNGLSALHIACACNQPECVRILLSHDAERYNYSDRWHALTPMGTACQYNHTECLKVLLDAKTDTSKGNDDGMSALHVACQFGTMDCVELLLQHGADVHAVNEDNETALQIAIATQHRQVARRIERFIEEENGY